MTCSPPKILIPSRWPAESRPLREDPPAFLCAIAGLQTFLAYVLYRIGDKSVTTLRHFGLLLFALRSRLFSGRSLRLGRSLFLLRGRGRWLSRALVTFRCRGRFGLRRLGPLRPRLFARLLAVGQNLGDAQQREFLTVAALAARFLPAALLERNVFRTAPPFDHLGRDSRAGYSCSGEGKTVTAH